MNIRHMHIFTDVVETGNMSETARKLFMTQPAVSQTILDLEDELKVKLFDRISKRLVLTDAGEILYSYSKRILMLMEESRNTIEELINIKRGRLRLGASTTIGIYLLPGMVGEFKKKYEDVETHFVIDNTGVVEQLVLDCHVDLGLVEGPTHSGDIESRHLMEDELFLICSGEHRWARIRGNSIDPDEFTREPLILREGGSGTREVVEEALSQRGISFSPCHVLNNTEAIKKAVEAGMGVAFVSKLAVQEELKSGRLVRVDLSDVTAKRALNIIYHKDKYRSRLFNLFMDHLLELASAFPGATEHKTGLVLQDLYNR